MGTVRPVYVPTSAPGLAQMLDTDTCLVGSLTINGLTSGSVLFAGTGGAVSQDNANFYWDDTNNRLGLGAGTAPAATLHVVQTVASSGANKGFIYTGAANTAQTAATEISGLTFTLGSRQWAAGAITTQREIQITQPTYSFVSASTITNAATLAIAGAPIQGTNATHTNAHALLIQAGAVTGAGASYGLTVNAQTGGTANYTAAFLGGYTGFGTATPGDYVDANGVRMPGIFTAQGEPTGYPAAGSGGGTPTFVNGTRIFTANPGPTTFTFYINGVLYTKTTLQTVTISNSTGVHYIYYDATATLTENTTFPGFSLPLVATVYWNATTSTGIIGEERHGIVMDGATHNYLHNTIGTRYVSGLTGTFANATFSITSGQVQDEDLPISIGAATTCDVFYKNSAVDATGNFIWAAAQTAIWGNSIGPNILYYNNVNALAAVGVGNYVAMWVFGTNAVTPGRPIAVIIGQRQDTSVANARTNNTYDTLSFVNLPFKEMKVLYRVLYRNVGGTPTYAETQDLRSVSNVPSGTYVATAHSSLTGLTSPADDHTQYLLLDGRGGQTISDTLTITENLLFAKEVDHTVEVDASTGTDANGGDLTVHAGLATNGGAGTGGDLLLLAGGEALNKGATGGSVTLAAGYGNTASGNVNITAGTCGGPGFPGTIEIGTAQGNASWDTKHVYIGQNSATTDIELRSDTTCLRTLTVNGDTTVGDGTGDLLMVYPEMLRFIANGAHTIRIDQHASTAGDNLSMIAGAAAGASNANGGDLLLDGGAKDGSGNNGTVLIGTVNPYWISLGVDAADYSITVNGWLDDDLRFHGPNGSSYTIYPTARTDSYGSGLDVCGGDGGTHTHYPGPAKKAMAHTTEGGPVYIIGGYAHEAPSTGGSIIHAFTWGGGTQTEFQTAANHGMIVGRTIYINGCTNPSYNGPWVVANVPALDMLVVNVAYVSDDTGTWTYGIGGVGGDVLLYGGFGGEGRTGHPAGRGGSITIEGGHGGWDAGQGGNQGGDVDISGGWGSNGIYGSVNISGEQVEIDSVTTIDGALTLEDGLNYKYGAVVGRSSPSTTATAGSTQTLWEMTLADTTVYHFEFTVSARDLSGTDWEVYKVLAGARREGGGAELGDVYVFWQTGTSPAWTIAVDTDGANAVRLRVNSATTVSWSTVASVVNVT